MQEHFQKEVISKHKDVDAFLEKAKADDKVYKNFNLGK